MSEKRYRKWLIAAVVLGMSLTLAHIGYAIYAYQHSSIIQFIGREWW